MIESTLPSNHLKTYTGIVYYYSVTFHCLHKVPDFNENVIADSSLFGKKYIEYTQIKNNSLGHDTNVEIPKIQDTSKWPAFRDYIIMRISRIIGECVFPISYVIIST